MNRARTIAALVGIALSALAASPLFAWGERGHRITAAAATAALPADMPAFFRDASAQLEYLDPEPDRWRDRAERSIDPALDGATANDHFIDLERIPAGHLTAVLEAPNRYAYLDSMRVLGVDGFTTGFLPFRILELEQRLRVEFRLWRQAADSTDRRLIQDRALNDAGILGHYVADGSNPMHTSIHHHGWVGPNPNGYATDQQSHARFESIYVDAQIAPQDVIPLVERVPRVLGDLRAEIREYLVRSNGQIERLYQLDKAAPFNAQTTSADDKRFVAARLADGATVLRDLWWTAWVTSADSAGAPRARP